MAIRITASGGGTGCGGALPLPRRRRPETARSERRNMYLRRKRGDRRLGRGWARGDLVGPVEQLHPAVMMLDQRGAALDPVAIVIIGHAGDVAHLGGVDMPAHHAIDAADAGGMRHDVLIMR